MLQDPEVLSPSTESLLRGPKHTFRHFKGRHFFSSTGVLLSILRHLRGTFLKRLPVWSLVPSRVVDHPQYLKLRSRRWPSGADLVGGNVGNAPFPGERDKGCSFRRVSVHGDAQRSAKLAGSAPSMQAVVPERTGCPIGKLLHGRERRCGALNDLLLE